MIYVKSNIYFTEVKQFKGLSSSVRSHFRTESLVLKVKLAKTWITVVAIYRPPSVPKLQWKYELSALFEAATALTSDVILAGDFNADLIKPDMPPYNGRDLLDLLDIFNLHNVIKSATRKAKTSATLLDLILTNNKRRILTSSDHSLVYTVLRASAPQSRSRKICFRSMKNFSQEQFLRDLHSAPFHIIDLFDDVDDKIHAFESLYLDILNEHAPLKQVHIRGNQIPYMTEQWRKAIRHRNRLWKKFTNDRNDENYANYKTQRN